MRWWRALVSASALVACTEDADPLDPGPEPDPGDGAFSVRLEPVASGLGTPVFATAPVDDGRLFVVLQEGRILVVEDGAVLPTPFLDIEDRVRSGGEQGLLGLAFHPSYAANGFFYVNYTGAGDGTTRVERYSVSSDPGVADPASDVRILTVEQPFSNHNGGQVEFGPDGMLYIGLGDGGSGGDPLGHGQDRGSLLGAILRIDVDGGTPYAIPADNPLTDDPDARPEIWAYGLRNPWRFALDGPGGHFYVADVGQSSREEINAVSITEGGLNFGWNVMEGTACYNAPSCPREGLTEPVLEYGHDEGCSVTGGLVYRGAAIPGMIGHYVYSDYCGGWLRSFLMSETGPTLERHWDEVPTLSGVTSFGRDAAGELYVLTFGGGGQVFKVVPRD